MRYKYLVILLITLFLSACDFAEDFGDLLKKQELAQQEIKETYGFDAQVGFNYSNGALTQVSIVFDSEQVREESVRRLEEISENMVSKVFSLKPQTLFVQIASVPE